MHSCPLPSLLRLVRFIDSSAVEHSLFRFSIQYIILIVATKLPRCAIPQLFKIQESSGRPVCNLTQTIKVGSNSNVDAVEKLSSAAQQTSTYAETRQYMVVKTSTLFSVIRMPPRALSMKYNHRPWIYSKSPTSST